MTKKKKKIIRDPNAPKRPLTAFMLFTNHRRPSLMKNNPSKLNLEESNLLEVKITEISVEIGKEWRALSDAE